MSNPISEVLTAIAGGDDALHAVGRMGAGALALVVLGMIIIIFISVVADHAQEFLIATAVIIGLFVLGGLVTRFFWEYLVPTWNSIGS